MGRGCATRSLMTAGVIAAVTLGASAGCTSGSPPTAAETGHPAASGATVPAAGAAPPSLSERGLASPGCSSATATESPLHAVATAAVKTSGSPFGIVAAPDGRWAFAVTGGGSGLAGASSVEVLSLSAGTGTDGAPNVTTVRSVPLPTAPGAAGLPAGAGTPAGAAITPDGKYLVVAEGAGVVVLSAARAEAGTAGAVLGSLGAPSSAGRPGGALGGAIEVAVSPDSRFVFVTLEADAEAAVFNLAAALAHGFGAADYVGAVPLGQAPVGMAVSPDGRWLYATSEGATAKQHPVGLAQAGSNGCGAGVPGAIANEPPGTLTVVDLGRAETDPAHAVTAVVQAGYQPVRVVTSADGTQVWVTARASDAVLCFSAARLATDPKQALVAVVRVGSEPVGLASVRGGALIAVADSNRFAASGQTASLSVVNVAAALAGRPAVVGDITTGMFPRDMAVSPDGTLLVSDYASGQVQAIATASLPSSG